MTLQRSLLMLFSAALLIIVGIATGASFNANEEHRNFQLSRESYQRLLLMEDLVTTLFEAESSQRAVLLTGDDLFVQEHRAQRQQLAQFRSQLESSHFSENISPESVQQLRELIAQGLPRRSAQQS